MLVVVGVISYDVLHVQLPIKVVRATVGDMSASDADMAVVANAIVVAFNTKLQQSISKQLSSV